MDNLSNTYYAKFPTQQKIIYFGQHGFSSRTDSFGDIPGHGVICIYLDLLVLWTLKSSLVLVSGTNFVDHKKEPIEGFKWSGMPMGETIQFVPSMLDKGYTVVAVSYKFSTRKNHYMRLIKTSLWIQKEISLQIYFFGIVYFFRYVKISSTLENNCAYTVDSFAFSGGRGCFSALLVSAVTQEYLSFLNTNLYLFSFSIQDFRYHKPVIFPDEVTFPVILFESSIFSRPGQILKTSFLFSIFFFCSIFEQFFFFSEFLPTTTISCFWFNNPMTEE